ncbi:recombinase family protein [Chloroflexota bacterium]
MEAIRAAKEGEIMKAAIYCRVSTEDQEREGTSLQTQLEACREYCQNKDYDVTYRFSEVYSGLTLERPKLNELRELVRAEDIDVIVCYCLDRLSRDPGHGVILTQELEKHRVALETVTEDVDNSELGKLISYIRGFASKLEAEKIRERTMRGKKARAREGRISGAFHTTFGYDYIPVGQKNGGRRVINETEAPWVKQIYKWLVYDGLTTGIIQKKLIALEIPTKKAGFWRKSSISSMLKNPSYIGKTLAFATGNKGEPRQRPMEEWIEIPDTTPSIISRELFDAAQKQLQANKASARRNKKREYLLSGYAKCRQCGHTYVGGTNPRRDGSVRRHYRCSGKWKERVTLGICQSKSWGADKLEELVWAELETYLSNRDLIAHELGKDRESASQLNTSKNELHQIERQLKVVDRDQRQLLQWALKGFPESQIEAENSRMNKSRETLLAQKMEMEGQIKASKDAVVDIPQLEHFIEHIQERIAVLDYEGKRQVLDILGITVWLDGQVVEVTGAIEPRDVIVTPQPRI